MFVRRFAIAVLFIVVGSPAVLAQGLTDQIPQGTVIAVQVRGLEQAQERLVAMANAMGDGLGDAAALGINEMKAQILEGRELRGVAKDGRVVFSLAAFPTGPEALAAAMLIVETTDYAALRDSIGGKAGEPGVKVESLPGGFDAVTRDSQTHYFVKRGKFTIVTEDRDSAAQLAKQKTTTPIKASKRVAATFEKGDVGIYVDMAAVNREYGEVIAGFKEQFAGLVEAAAGAQPGLNPEQAKAQAEMTRKIFDGMFTFVEETTAVVASGSFEKTGLALSLFAEVKPDGSSAKFLSLLKPGANPLVGQLPDGHQMYFGFAGGQELYQAVSGLATSFMAQTGISGKALEKQLELMKEAGPHSVAGAVRFGKGLSGVSISTFDKPAAALEASLAGSEASAEAKIPGMKEVKIERNVLTHRSVKLSKVTMQFDFDALAGQAGGEIAAAQLRAFFGDGMVQWLGVTDRGLVQIMGPDAVAARAALDQVLDQKRVIKQDEGFAEAMKRLPAESTLVALIDLPSFMSAILQQMAGVAEGIPAIEPPPGKPTYFGLALVGQSNAAELAIWFPAAMVGQFMQMFQGLGAGAPNER